MGLAVTIAFAGGTRPAMELPDAPVTRYVANSGHREFLAGPGITRIVETSLLPGFQMINDLPDYLIPATNQMGELTLQIPWISEQIINPTGQTRTEILSITASGLSLHAVAQGTERYSLIPEGVTALPLDPTPGDEWKQTATAVNLAGDSSEFTRTASIADSTVQAGCLDMRYTDTLAGHTVTRSVTRCPSRGVVAIDGLRPGGPPTRNAGEFIEPPVQITAPTTPPGGFIVQSAEVRLNPAVVVTPAALGPGIVYANSNSGQLVYTQPDEQSQWRLGWTRRPGKQILALLGAGDLVIAGTIDRRLVAYDAAGGWLWEQRIDDTVANLIRVGTDRFAVITMDGQLSMRVLADGTQTWSGPAAAGGPAIPQVLKSGSEPLIASAAGTQLLITGPDGRIGNIPVLANVQSLTVLGERLIAAGDNAAVDAFDATGRRLWQTRIKSVCRQLIALDELVICATRTGLIALRADDGGEVWSQTTNLQTATALADQQILAVGNDSDWLIAADGTIAQNWSLDQIPSSAWPLHTRVGLVVFGSEGSGHWWPQ